MGKLMACLATLEEAFQKSSNGLRFFGGENIGFLDIACGTIFGPVSVIEAFPALNFSGKKQHLKFRVHEAVKPYMPTVEEFIAFAKKKFGVE